MSRPPRPINRPLVPVTEGPDDSSDDLLGAFEGASASTAPEESVDTSGRPPLRAALREEDPRAAAERRAAEIMGNIGDIDEGPDDFYVDPKTIPDGWEYEWKRKTAAGQEDPAYQVQLARTGWEAVPAKRHPSFMPIGSSDAAIERKGLILMQRPKIISDHVRARDQRNAKNQIRTKESQLTAVPSGQFERQNKGNSLVQISKGYEPMPIPE